MKRAHYRLLPRAREDIITHAEYIGRRNETAALSLVDAVLATCEQLVAHPRLGVKRMFKHRALAEVRMLRVEHFDAYLVFYRPQRDGVDVVRVVHGARDLPMLFGRAT